MSGGDRRHSETVLWVDC